MRSGFLSRLAVISIILAGCNTGKVTTTLVNTSQNTVSTLKNKSPETDVNQKRLEANLAVLTGKAPMADGVSVKERGSVEGRQFTRRFITSYLESIGYKVEKHSYRKNGENILVHLMADTPTDEYILLGAHMDSVHNAGADDNGSGSVAVLEAATVLKNLPGRKVNIIFAWFDEEELGLIGSEYMAKDFRKKGMKLTSVHTADMIGWDKDNDKAVEIERPDSFLWDYYVMVNKTHSLNLPLKRTNSGSTDHVAFRAEGFTSVGICEEWAGGDTTPYYHKKTDTYDTINFAYLTSTTKLIVAAIGDLSLKVPAPKNIKLVPHDKFPGRDRHFHNH